LACVEIERVSITPGEGQNLSYARLILRSNNSTNDMDRVCSTLSHPGSPAHADLGEAAFHVATGSGRIPALLYQPSFGWQTPPDPLFLPQKFSEEPLYFLALWFNRILPRSSATINPSSSPSRHTASTTGISHESLRIAMPSGVSPSSL